MARLRTLLDRIPRRLLAGPLAVVAVGMMAFSVLVLTGVAASGEPAAVSTNPMDIAAGQALYNAHCQSCHGIDGTGGVNNAPELIDAGAAAADFYLTTGRMPLNNPSDEAMRHHPYFNQTQIRQLDAYVNALPEINHSQMGGPAIPNVLPLCPPSQRNTADPPGNCVTLSQGERNFQLNCAQCHQAVGSGGLLSKGEVIPSLHNASSLQAAEAMRVGPKPMPVFGPGQLSEQQVSSIARYVAYLRTPDDRGGLGIGHFGPVVEGFVGIIIGLGLMLIASRWIGTRG